MHVQQEWFEVPDGIRTRRFTIDCYVATRNGLDVLRRKRSPISEILVLSAFAGHVL